MKRRKSLGKHTVMSTFQWVQHPFGNYTQTTRVEFDHEFVIGEELLWLPYHTNKNLKRVVVEKIEIHKWSNRSLYRCRKTDTKRSYSLYSTQLFSFNTPVNQLFSAALLHGYSISSVMNSEIYGPAFKKQLGL